jgi:hypothetical protein
MGSNMKGSRQLRKIIQVVAHRFIKMRRWLKIDRSVWIEVWRGPAEQAEQLHTKLSTDSVGSTLTPQTPLSVLCQHASMRNSPEQAAL